MIRTVFQRVCGFHRACEIPVADAPTQIPLGRRQLRAILLIEEFCEVMAELHPSVKGRAWVEGMRVELTEDSGIYMSAEEHVDLPALAKELVDLEVVTVGAAAEFGLPHDEVAEAVCDSNDAKAGGPRRADGKVLKPEGWQPPDVRALVGG